MKYSVVSLLLPFLVHAAPAIVAPQSLSRAVFRRQEVDDDPKLNGASAFKGIPLRKAYRISDIPPKTGIQGAKRTKFIYGPFKARGSGDKSDIPLTSPSMDSAGGTAYNFQLDTDFPRDITVLVTDSDLLTKDMKQATLDDKVYNHHNAFMEVVKKQEPLYRCENASIKAKLPDPVNLFAGTATEKINFNFTSTDPKQFESGFHIPKDAVLQNMVDLVNLGPTREFYTVNEIEYIPGPGLPAGYINNKQIMLNPDICGGPDGNALHPPVGKSKFQVATSGVIMDADGWFIASRGHLHDGGMEITLDINGKLMCRSEAMYGGPGFEYKDDSGKLVQTINKATTCTTPFRVKAGDKLNMVANFDLDKHPSRPMGNGAAKEHNMRNLLDGGDAEQMALMFVYFAKDVK